MPKNEQPIFPRAPVIGVALIDTANPNLDGTGAIVDVVAGGADGTRIDSLRVKAIGTTTAGMVRLFLSTDNGVTYQLWREIPVAAITPSATVAAFEEDILLDDPGTSKPLLLPSADYILAAATENAEDFQVFAHGQSLAAE